MENVFTIILGAVATAVIWAGAYALIKRQGEKKQNALQVENQQQEEPDDPRLSPQELTAHLADHDVDNSQLKTRFHSLDLEFMIAKNRNEQPSPLLKENLHSLDDLIEWQITEDEQWLKQVALADLEDISKQLHHGEWRQIQAKIRQKVGPSPKK